MTTLSRIGITSMAVATLATAGLLAAPAPTASAHGFVGGTSSSLISRAAWAANADRGPAQYEPQSLEAPKGFPATGPADGRLASAGGLFGGALDEQSSTRWAKNVVQAGPVQVAWSLTAAHRTAKWSYYITKQGWDQNDGLERSDLELLTSFDGGGGVPLMSTVHTLTVPADHTGYHVIYAVWDIADTTNAFYNTIDIDVRSGGNGTPVPPVVPPATPPVTVPPATVPPVTPVDPASVEAPAGLHTMGRTATTVDLMWKAAQGATGYRVERSTDGQNFTAVGTPTAVRFVDTGLSAATTYQYRVVALSAQKEAVSTVLTVTTAPATPTTPTTPTAPPTGTALWSANGSYTRGALVQHDGVTYRAAQTHRGWGDPTWITARALWEPVPAASDSAPSAR